MKVLTIRQPYVAAIFAGLKTFETRGKPTTYRGRLAIHSAARFDDRANAMMFRADQLTLGCIIGIVDLVDCIRTEDVPRREAVWGDFAAGRWAWQIERPRLLVEPIPAKGALSFWTFDVPGTFL